MFCHTGGIERQVWSDMPTCIYAYKCPDALQRKAQRAAVEAVEVSCLYSRERLLSMSPVLLWFEHTVNFFNLS